MFCFWSGRLDAVLETGNRCCLRAGNKKQYLAVCGWNGSCGNDGDSRGQWFNAVDVSGILYADHKQNQRFLAALPALKWEELFACAAVLIPFGIGVVLGIFLVSKLVEYLLKKQERKTYFAIMGLVTSSPIAVLSGMNIVSIGFGQQLLGILLFIGGFFIANILGK